MSDVSIAAEVEEAGGQPVNAETTGHKLHWVPVHGHRPSPRWKPLLKLANKKAYKQTAEDKQSKSMNHWKHFLWFDETRSTCSGGVQHVWQCPAEEYCVLSTVKRGGERHGLGLRACFVHWGTAQLSEGNRNSNLHCECPKQSTSSSLRKLDHMVVFPTWKPPYWGSWRWGWSLSPDMNPMEEHRVLNIHQLCELIMEQWERILLTTCAAPVNPMPKRIKAVLTKNIENTLGTIWTY